MPCNPGYIQSEAGLAGVGSDRTGTRAGDLVNAFEVVEQRRQQIERIGVGTVAQRVLRILVHFHEHRVDSHRGRGPGQRCYEFALPV